MCAVVSLSLDRCFPNEREAVRHCAPLLASASTFVFRINARLFAIVRRFASPIDLCLPQLAVSITIVPEEECVARPVGDGQGQPNETPFLPPAVGRFSMSLNPISIIKELIGPEVVIILVCCCICVLCLFALMFLGQYYVTAYTMINTF